MRLIFIFLLVTVCLLFFGFSATAQIDSIHSGVFKVQKDVVSDTIIDLCFGKEALLYTYLWENNHITLPGGGISREIYSENKSLNKKNTVVKIKVYLEINSKGFYKIEKIENAPNKKFELDVENSLRNYTVKWIPATKNGIPIKSIYCIWVVYV